MLGAMCGKAPTGGPTHTGTGFRNLNSVPLTLLEFYCGGFKICPDSETHQFRKWSLSLLPFGGLDPVTS